MYVQYMICDMWYVYVYEYVYVYVHAYAYVYLYVYLDVYLYKLMAGAIISQKWMSYS